MKDLLRYDLLELENEAMLNIDKIIVRFSVAEDFKETISKMEVGEVIEQLDCNLRLKSVSIDDGEDKTYEVEIINAAEIFGRLRISDMENTCLFFSAQQSGYTLLKRDASNKISVLSYLETLATSLGLTYANIEEITFGLDTSRNILIEIRERLENLDHSDEFDNIDEVEEDTIFIMETQYGKDKPLPIGSWQNNCLLITDTFANCNKLKIYISSIMSPERRGVIANWNEFETPLFYRVELKAFSNEINYAVEEYNENHNLNCSPLEILGRMEMAKYVFNYLIENMPTEMLEIDVVPDYFLKTLNERHHEENHLIPMYIQRRLNIDALKLKCRHDGNLYSIIKNVPVGENIPLATTDYDLKVIAKKFENEVMFKTVVVSTTDGTFGYLSFKEGCEECSFEIDRKVSYTLLTRNIHEGTKHSMLGCLVYIIEDLDLKLVDITNMTVCCDIDHNLIDKIFDTMIETEGKDNDDIIFTLVSMIKGKGDEAKEEDLYKSTLIYRNVKTGTPQLRIYTSPSIADEDVRNMIEDWNEFNRPFSRVEITLNEEQIKNFLSGYTLPYGNDYPLLSFIDDEEFKRSILLYVVDNHIEPNKTDFDIRVEEV